MTGWDDEALDIDRAPICPACGVTALPSEGGGAFAADTTFVCENPDCEAYGEPVP